MAAPASPIVGLIEWACGLTGGLVIRDAWLGSTGYTIRQGGPATMAEPQVFLAPATMPGRRVLIGGRRAIARMPRRTRHRDDVPAWGATTTGGGLCWRSVRI